MGAPARVLLFNKPYDLLCQFTDPDGRATLATHIQAPGLYPAGRLDRDSEGLLVLTDDGMLQSRITHPRHKLEKTYWVQVEGEPSSKDLRLLRTGVRLNDGLTAPAAVRVIEAPILWPRNPPIRERRSIPTTWLELRIREGRNRQIRRMTGAVAHPTLRLVRVAIGDWTLGDLQPGQWREVEVGDAAAIGITPSQATPRRRTGKRRIGRRG